MSIIKKHIIIGLLVGLTTTIFSFSQIGELWELKGYDIFHVLKIPAHPPEDIVIVAIDEPSFAEIGKQWPWPRSIHAKLIDVLKKEGASVIGFDILFSEPSQLNEDTILADSIKRAGNVCLASDIEVLSNKKYIQEIVVEPLQKLKPGAFTGLVHCDINI